MLITSILKPLFFSKIKEYVIPDDIDPSWEYVVIPVGENKTLAARLLRGISNSKICAFLIHPYHRDAKDYFLYSGHPELYHALGFHVVIFDLNGFGQSDDIGFEFEHDIQKVVEHMSHKLETSINIGHGISFGAAMLIKNLHLPTNIFDKAIIENCLDETPNYYKKRNKSLYLLMKFLFLIAPGWKASNQYFRVIQQINNMDELCLIYNIDDDLTTPAMGRKLEENAATKIQYHLIKGKHMESIRTDPSFYKSIIKSYIKC